MPGVDPSKPIDWDDPTGAKGAELPSHMRSIVQIRQDARREGNAAAGPEFREWTSAIDQQAAKMLTAASKAEGEVAGLEESLAVASEFKPAERARIIEEAEQEIAAAHREALSMSRLLKEVVLPEAALPEPGRTSPEGVTIRDELRVTIEAAPADRVGDVYAAEVRRALDGSDDPMLSALLGSYGRRLLDAKLEPHMAESVWKSARNEALPALAQRDDLPAKRRSALRLLTLKGSTGPAAVIVTSESLASTRLDQLKRAPR